MVVTSLYKGNSMSFNFSGNYASRSAALQALRDDTVLPSQVKTFLEASVSNLSNEDEGRVIRVRAMGHLNDKMYNTDEYKFDNASATIEVAAEALSD